MSVLEWKAEVASFVIPAKAEIQSVRRLRFPRVPVFAGMTKL